MSQFALSSAILLSELAPRAFGTFLTRFSFWVHLSLTGRVFVFGKARVIRSPQSTQPKSDHTNYHEIET